MVNLEVEMLNFSRSTRLLAIFFAVLVAGCGKKMTEDELYQQAREYELAVEYDKAAKSYQKLVKDFPESAKNEEARGKLELLQSAKTLERDQLYAEIAKHEAREKFENAVIFYNALLERFPKDEKRDEVLQKLGLVYLNHEGQYQKAVEAYERLLEEYPASAGAAQAQFMIGYIYANHLKELDKARAAYNTFKEKYPQHELMTSVNWELEHLGQDISSIDIFTDSKEAPKATADQTDSPSHNSAPSGPSTKQ